MEKCSERVESHYKSRLEDIKMLYSVANGNSPETEEVSSNSFWEYNLCLDFDCNLGCFRYLISTGGPSEEIRFYAVQTSKGWKLHSAEFWLMDWFDGAKVNVEKPSDEYALLEEIFWCYDDIGSLNSVYKEAIANEMMSTDIQ